MGRLASGISRMQMHIGSRQKEGRKLQSLQLGRSKSHANAEANHIKMFNHLPGFCLSTPSPHSGIPYLPLCFLSLLLDDIGPVSHDIMTDNGKGERGGERGTRRYENIELIL